MAASAGLLPLKRRTILPLPRRSLRERLPPDVAATIEYPPSSSTRVFPYLPDTPPRGELFAQRAYPDVGKGGVLVTEAAGAKGMANGLGRYPTPQDPSVPRSAPELGRMPPFPPRSELSALSIPQPSPSAASSSEGLDILECNNKKKRKIPTASDAAVHSVLGEYSPPFSTSSISPATSIHSSALDTSSSSPSSYTSTGISGSGRGTLAGRSRHSRAPLRDLHGSHNNWAHRALNSRLMAQTAAEKRRPGIISSAIADAEKAQTENQFPVSPALSSDFSFRCKSQVPGGGLLDPPDTLQRSAPSASHSTAMPKERTGPKTAPAPDPAAVERQNRRTLAREYAQAARARRQRQTLENLHNPPKPDDRWLCEFCEYESIFGEPPRALTRQYEIKDRRIREQEAERRRLLEKAKAKSRKAKKAANPAKNAPTNGIMPPGPPGNYQHPARSGSMAGQLPPEDTGGWGLDGVDQGGSSHNGDLDSDAVDMDSDSGPPDLFREYAHPDVPRQITTERLGG